MANKDIHRKTYQDLKTTLEAIPNNQHRVLLKTIYSGLARVGEIVKPRYKTYQGQGLMGKDISYTETTLTLLLITEKRNTERRVPVARLDNPSHQYFQQGEAWLTEDIINYTKLKDKDYRVWDFSTRTAENIFKKYFPEHKNHIHLLRHWRTTHLLTGQATGKPIPMSIVAKLGGWDGTGVLSKTYDGAIIEDYWGF